MKSTKPTPQTPKEKYKQQSSSKRLMLRQIKRRETDQALHDLQYNNKQRAARLAETQKNIKDLWLALLRRDEMPTAAEWQEHRSALLWCEALIGLNDMLIKANTDAKHKSDKIA